jgi:hypothetical protein
MKVFAKSLLGIFAFFAASIATPAQAQNFGHTYIASTGNDTNNSCTTVDSPCKTFTKAYAQTAPRGMITCVNTLGFISATISKSLKVDCDGAFVTLNVITGPSDIVVLRGVKLDSNSSGSGISFTSSGTLVLDGISFADPHGPQVPIGINFAPSGPAKLIVLDSLVTAAGAGATGGGIIVKPTGNGNAQISLERTNVVGNVFGIALDGSDSTGGINATIADSTFSSNSQDGIVATSAAGHAPIGVTVKNSKSINNAIGIRSIGPNVTVRVDGSSVIGNGTGLATLSGGTVLSAGNNMIQANGTNGAFTGHVPLQ